MAGVRLEGLAKRFGRDGAAAVRDVSLEVADGEFMVLVGPSGCGKTTVLRMIAGLEAPTAGRVRIGDDDVTTLPPRDRDVAMVFQSYALYPHMSVRENIGFGLRMRGAARADRERRVEEAAGMLGIEALLDRRPAQLSGGQRQRVALARAIVREPRVFLFDEPLSNLDAQVRARTRAELVRLHQRLGATMIYVTHDQVEAMTMAGRVAVMNRGRVEQVAPPLELYHQPATRFVASFLGSPPINWFPGRVAAGPGGAWFEGALRVPVAAAPAERAELGVRPEQLRLVGAGEGAAATVSVVEPLGAETLVVVRLADGSEATVRVAGDPPVAAGASVGLGVAEGAGLLFDPGTGERLR